MLLLILGAIALLLAWAAGAFVPKSTGMVVDKHTTTSYMTQGKGKTAYSIPLETFLLIDTFGRHCKVPRGVWANVQVGETVEGRWRGGAHPVRQAGPNGPRVAPRTAEEPVTHHCQRPLPPGARFCPVCGIGVRQPQAENRPPVQRTTPSLGVWQLMSAAAFGFLVILALAYGREVADRPIQYPAANAGSTLAADASPPLQRTAARNEPVLGGATGVSDEAPSWYQGSKPWSEIGEEGRATMLRMRAAYEAQQAAANQPGPGSDGRESVEGRLLINKIVQRYGLDPVYKNPDTFGSRMVIWLPTVAWAKLSATQKKSIEAYMSSNYSNWGIGVGRVRGKDVLYDDVVVQH